MKLKVIALMLCAVLTLMCFAGCVDPATVPSPGASESPAASPETTASLTVDFAAAKATFDNKEVMFTVSGSEVLWEEFFYWLNYAVSTVQQYGGPITDWDAVCAFDETLTYREFVDDYAVTMAIQYHSVEAQAALLGAGLSAEDEAEVEEYWATNVETYGSGDEAAFEKYLESLFMTRDFFYYMNRVSFLYDRSFEKLYGDKGSLLEMSEVEAYIESNEIVGAKHILLLTVDMTTGESLSEEVISEKLSTAGDILTQVNSATDKAAKFDELMLEYSEDSGLEGFPDGYVYTPGSMVTEFEAAVTALNEGEVSEVVKTDYGYHIIMRIPVEPDSMLEYSEETGEPVTIRQAAALEQLSTVYAGWIESADVQFTDSYNSIDYAVMFGAK